jgi:hypothetical protein
MIFFQPATAASHPVWRAIVVLRRPATIVSSALNFGRI